MTASRTSAIPRVATFKSVQAFRAHLATLPIAMDCDEALAPAASSPLAQPIEIAGRRVGNRFCVHPMEGWDGTPDGRPSDLTLRRWRNFGLSGAKLVWGGEAFAVRREGRANPNQLYFEDAHRDSLDLLLRTLKRAHRDAYGGTDDLLVGLQLTHSGRFCRPEADRAMRPRIAFRHPLLDPWFGVAGDEAVLSDMELDGLVEDFVRVARAAAEAGFDFVDIKHCHGYLLHELLSARTRPGPYGGPLENRTRLLRQIVAGIRRDAPALGIGVRLSMFDLVPFRKPEVPRGPGLPADVSAHLPYRYGFGVNAERPTEIDLTEPKAFLRICSDLGISLLNLTAASPYYNPHAMRPAFFPPSDGYPPPEDPLLGCARLLWAAAECRRAVPGPAYVGTGYTYLQEYLPHVAQAQVRLDHIDLVGLGRSMLSYPELPRDLLGGRALEKRHLCRTFSDCTTGPRNGMISGCFPLDAFYKRMPEAGRIKVVKAAAGLK